MSDRSLEDVLEGVADTEQDLHTTFETDVLSEAYNEVLGGDPRRPFTAEELDRREALEIELGRIHAALRRLTDRVPSGDPFDRAVLDYLTGVVFDKTSHRITTPRGLDRATRATLEDWFEAEPADQQAWLLYVLKQARSDSFRELVAHLEETPRTAERLGLDSADIKAASTYSRRINDALQGDERAYRAALDELAHHAIHAAVRAGVAPPTAPEETHQIWQPSAGSDLSFDEKMAFVKDKIRERFVSIEADLGFDRDREAPNFQYPLWQIYAFLAHLALEGTTATQGAKTLPWLGLQSDVPEQDTLFTYIRSRSIDEIRDQVRTTAVALTPGYALPDAVDVAFDVTNVRWYGNQGVPWTTGVPNKDNTTQAWKFAIASIVEEDHSYVIGTAQIPNEKHLAAWLDQLLLTPLTQAYPTSINRVYLDSKFYREAVVTTLRQYDVEYLIQARDTGEFEALLDKAEAEADQWRGKRDPVAESNIGVGEFEGSQRPNGFAAPIPPEEVGAGRQDRTHTAFVTDIDVGGRDLEGLARQYRHRWGIETNIRDMKHQFLIPTTTDDRQVREFYFGTAAIFYNLYQRVRWGLADEIDATLSHGPLTMTEFLHAFRDISFEA